MARTYAIREVFPTLQGEGAHAGRSAVFVRFAGCNLWSGHAAHRERDAERNGARCPLWCDTDFARGDAFDARTIADLVGRAAWHLAGKPALVVFTGGEPMLQLDRDLLDEVRQVVPGARMAVETNGTVLPKSGVDLDWICVSPKTPLARLRITGGHELKVVVPAYDPLAYRDVWHSFDHLFVSPEARTSGVGVSVIDRDNTRRAIEFVMAHPLWRLSLQTHKMTGLP